FGQPASGAKPPGVSRYGHRTRMSRTSIAVTTGIGITATGIGESGARAAPSWVPGPARVDGTL
ncbi:MAG: hypothetical protein WBD96_08790, partial [Pseudolabrys sp.]